MGSFSRGNDWFVGSITNDRDIKINCSFLAPGKKYKAAIYYDDPSAPSRSKISLKEMIVNSVTVLDNHLLPSGGQAIWSRRIDSS